MAFVIRLDYPGQFSEYILGGTYVVNHERYACVTQNIREAKKYRSEKNAKSAIRKMGETCNNIPLYYEILEV